MPEEPKKHNCDTCPEFDVFCWPVGCIKAAEDRKALEVRDLKDEKVDPKK